MTLMIMMNTDKIKSYLITDVMHIYIFLLVSLRASHCACLAGRQVGSYLCKINNFNNLKTQKYKRKTARAKQVY